MAGGTPAFPALRVLGARASRSHGGRNALLGNAASRHARKKPTPLRRVGVGAMFKSHCKDTYQSHGRSLQLPPSCRFPPLREGNRARVRFPLLAGGTLRRGSSIALVFVNSGSAIGIRRELRVNAAIVPPSICSQGSYCSGSRRPTSVYAPSANSRMVSSTSGLMSVGTEQPGARINPRLPTLSRASCACWNTR